MLILTRKNNEEIVINSEIVVKILSVSEGNVKIGITAPGNVKILRGEIYEKVKQTTREASENSKFKFSELGSLKLNKLGDYPKK